MCQRVSIPVLARSVTMFATLIAAGCLPPGASSSESPEKPTPEQPGATRAKPNRLIRETSPYLLMHAHNPVDWYPWGPEAFNKAKAEGKMVFLSVGYSSCYWCHVMERESFMDEKIAGMLNEHFVAIKVDREERPDVDQIYMTALGIYFRAAGSSQGGGWPMSMFLTPEADPIMGGTYFPPRDKGGTVGFLTLLRRLQAAWESDPQRLTQSAERLSEIVQLQMRGQMQGGPAAPLEAGLADRVSETLADQFDPEYGGFGYSEVNPRYPKFPEPSNLVFLLDRVRRGRNGRVADDRAETMLLRTLEAMALGGIRDHLGGGFHRYSTDRFWRIPHFEKMLYDNAQLTSVYAHAYALFGRDDFRRVVEETLEFVLREMTAPEGGFYSALDAETGEEEGLFYVWDREELERRLDDEEFLLFAEVYGVGEEGNFEGRHVLLLEQPVAAVAEARGEKEEVVATRLAAVRKKLLAARTARPRPLTDTKILTAWNGLMIRGMADAGRLLDRPQYVRAAETAATSVLEKLRTPDGRLLRTYSGGRAQLNAYLDDYAFFVDGLLALHQATGQRRWLDEARALTDKQIDLFWDDELGGFFFTSGDHEKLIARSKDPADSVLPSGNAVTVGSLIYLAAALDEPEYFHRAEKTLQAFAALSSRAPSAVPRMAVSLAAWLDVHE